MTDQIIAIEAELEPARPQKELSEILAFDGNLCELFDESDLSSHLLDVQDGIAKDKESMSNYLKKYERAVKRCKLEPGQEEKNFPFSNASNIVLPYVLDAALDFNARSVPPLLERQNICYIQIHGKDEHVIPNELKLAISKAAQEQGRDAAMQMQQQVMQQLESQPTPKAARAGRVSAAINYELQCGISGWRESIDRAMMILPVVGMMFTKTYQCPVRNEIKSELVMPDDMIYDHKSDCFESAPRKSFEFELTRNEVVTNIRSGQYCNMDRVLDSDLDTKTFTFVESHCEIDLDDDGYAEPYIVVIDKANSKFVSILPLFSEEDLTLTDAGEVIKICGEQFFSQTIFIPNPDGTATGLGYGILLGDMFDIIDTNTNQMVDAGTLNNVSANSGFIRAGTTVGPRAANRQKKGIVDMQMGKFTTIESSGTTPLQNDIAQLPFSGPSTALAQLLENLKKEAREMTAVSTVIDANPNEAMGLYLARLHQSLVKPNSIMIRVFNGLTKQFQRIYDIHARYLGQDKYEDIIDDPNADWELDYQDDYDIKTTADPSQGSEMERAARAESYLAQAKQLPQVFNLRDACEMWAEANGLDPEDAIMKPQPNQPDPIQLIIAQAEQSMSEAEQMKGQAEIIAAQSKLIEANINLAKLDIEIEEIESKILKNLSEVDKNQSSNAKSEREMALAELKNQRDNLRELINVTQSTSQRMATPPNNQSIPGSAPQDVGFAPSGSNKFA